MMGFLYTMGIDIGTTSTKAVIFKKDGAFVHRAGVEYSLHTPEPSAAEQDPNVIFRAVLTSIRTCIEGSGVPEQDIGFLSFSSAMHSVIAVDEEGRPLTPSITWADSRSTKWTEKLKNEWNGHEIYLRTGTPIHPMAPLSKIIWLREEFPELFRQTAKFLSIKEYIFYRLFGDYVIDYSIASATGMFNLEKLDWDKEALQIAGIDAKRLSKPVSTTHVVRGMAPGFAVEAGIRTDMPVVIGASDGVLSNLGTGAIKPGDVAVTIGTSGAIRAVTNKPVTDPKGRIFCYALTEDHWVIGGPVNNGGMIFRWVRDELGAAETETAKRLGKDPYDVLTEIAARIPAGSEGLLFHPYFSGERAPLWNADARGSFFGLALHHKKEHMIRAVLEGILYNLYTVLLALEELTGEPQRILATGGFAQSDFWRQMMADVFDHPVIVPESFESSCFGAVLLGLYGLGEIDSLDVAADASGTVFEHVPNKANSDVYRELIPSFIRIARFLEPEYKTIADFQRRLSSK
ncbi:gluconokinase [Domibacillus tundrae]|uniref:gluconokinase n=1 Tax=Domibacillus tundrae TaxID=1587527 RepID=UPI000A68129A|nr:gluconokinase [Domibacillus tundrae]